MVINKGKGKRTKLKPGDGEDQQSRFSESHTATKMPSKKHAKCQEDEEDVEMGKQAVL